MRFLAILSLPCLFFAISSATFADESGSDVLETVVVTATRTPQPREVTGTSVSVVTADDLKTEQTVVLSDVLAETPGLNITRNGGVGEDTEISIRGSAPGQVLVLVDGIRINDPSTPDGTAVLSDLLVNNIERAEILRGPQSTLYGSQAIGGVVNIITDLGGEGFSARGSVEGGSLGTYHLNAATNGTYGAVEYGAAVNYFETAGIAAADSRNPGTNPDGYHNFGATLNTRTNLNEALRLDIRSYYTNSRNDFDGFPPPTFTLQYDGEFGTDELAAFYAGLNLSLLDGKFLNRLAFTGSESDHKDFGVFDPTTFAFSPAENLNAKGDATRIEYQGIVALASESQLTFGAEDERTSLNVGSAATQVTLDPILIPLTGHTGIDSFYAQLQTLVWDGLTLTGGLRDDDDQTFGNHTSVKLTGAWQLFESQTVLRANYGDGFKAPTLFQLFSQYSNPTRTLAPEAATGWETGIDQYLWDKRIRLAATYFERQTSNQIEFVSCFGVSSPVCTLRPDGYYDNIARSRATGVELEALAQLTDTLSVSANYTHLDAIDLSDGTVLARTPRDMAFARVTWKPAKNWSLAASMSFTGSSFDQAEEVGPLGSYALENIYASYALTDQLELFGHVENLFDTHYEQTLGYHALGRTAYAGIRATI